MIDQEHTCIPLEKAHLKVIWDSQTWEVTDYYKNVAIWPIYYCPCCGEKLERG